MEPVTFQAEIGKRIAQARETASLTQAELAQAMGVDRTSVVKLENGSRKVSATELVAIAQALDRSIDWFVFESPPAVVSRRSDPAVGGQANSLDVRVERLGRDVAFLLAEEVLSPVERPVFDVPSSQEEAESLARDARALMGIGDGPIHDLQRSCERAGLLAFSLDLGAAGGDAAYVELGDWGVALVNGAIDPGRRRFNVAHELAHHLVGDAYAPEASILSGDGTEHYLNAFAIHLLMPRGAVTGMWESEPEREHRLRAIALAARFRVSWTATCSQLRTFGLINATEREELASSPPVKGEFFEVGEWWLPELDAPSVPPGYASRVVHAYRCGKLTAARTIELLWGTMSEDELPDVEEIPLEGLRREFEPL